MFGISLAGIGLKLLGFGGALKSAAAKIPPKVWYALAAVALLVSGVVYHQHRIRKHDAAIIQAEDNRINTMALKMKAKVDALTARISADERNRNDEQNRRIAADAGDLRVLGPGKAVCPGRTGVPAGPGGHVAPRRSPDAAVDPLPDAAGIELIGLPFNDAVSFGADHDVDRAEVISWREWYRKMVANWSKQASPPRQERFSGSEAVR